VEKQEGCRFWPCARLEAVNERQRGNQWKLTGVDGDHWIALKWKLFANNAEVLRDAAARGCGIAVVPVFIAEKELKNGALRSILADYRPPALSLYALYPPTPHLAVKVRLFIDFLIRHIG
jgi:DNA-binding transcriptional LysR family regulator